MNIPTTLSVTKARENIFQIVNRVNKRGGYYFLTQKGETKAVLISRDDFESWTETLDVLDQFPNLEKEVERIDEDVTTEVYKTYPTLEEVLSDYGLMLINEKGKRYDVVSSKVRIKGKKRSKKNPPKISR